MIDDIGGLTVNVPFRMLDTYSHADLQPGVQELSGDEALAMARDRHSMLSGDFTRQENGGRLFLAALAQFQKEYAQDPTALLTWLGAGLSNMSTTLTADQVVQLAYTVTAQPVKKVQNIVVPGSSEMIGGVSAVALNDAAASAIMSDVSQDGVVAKKNVPPSPSRNQPVGG
jgi:anionic cell wall polymer biosynthesis LytR-Cps2A-Psr (LCP) family protein